ncbi:MAG: hypothetical protein ACEY3B_05315 [Wolbachia sp.]
MRLRQGWIPVSSTGMTSSFFGDFSAATCICHLQTAMFVQM